MEDAVAVSKVLAVLVDLVVVVSESGTNETELDVGVSDSGAYDA